MEKKTNKGTLTALQLVQKKHGKDSAMRLGDNKIVEFEGISSQSIVIDKALGGKGYPKGRIIEFWGPEGSGKSTMSLHAIAEAQKEKGKQVVLIDVEHAFDPTYARTIGVDINNLIISQPTTAEEALDIAEIFVQSGEASLIVIDSTAALVPKAELEGEIGDATVALLARLLSKALRRLLAEVRKSNTCVIFINQIRDKIGVRFGAKTTTPGGRALKFYASLRAEVVPIGKIKDSDGNIIGQVTQVTTKKNKVAPPFKSGVINLIFGEGIDLIMEIVDLAIKYDIIKKSGAWYVIENEKFQGKAALKELLKDDVKLLSKIKKEVKKCINS